MSLNVECFCGKQFKVRDDLVGKRVKCPECGSPVLVSDDDELPDSPAPTRSPRKAKGKKSSKSTSSTAKFVLIGLAVAGITVFGCCGGAVLWMKSTLEQRVAEGQAEMERLKAERRAKGEPTNPEEYPPLTIDDAAGSDLVQEVSLGRRTFRIPAEFQPAALPPGVNIPVNVTVRNYECALPGSTGKLAFIAVAEPARHTTPGVLSFTHAINFSNFQRTSSLSETIESPVQYGRFGDYFVARSVVVGTGPNGVKYTTVFNSILDGDQLLSISVGGLPADDAAALKRYDAILGTLK